jgi:hypothetical protein
MRDYMMRCRAMLEVEVKITLRDLDRRLNELRGSL